MLKRRKYIENLIKILRIYFSRKWFLAQPILKKVNPKHPEFSNIRTYLFNLEYSNKPSVYLLNIYS